MPCRLECGQIVLIALLSFIVLVFFTIIIVGVWMATKVAAVTAPLRNAANVIKRVRSGSLNGMSKDDRATVVKQTRTTKNAIQKDMQTVLSQMKPQLEKATKNVRQLINRGLAILSGDACAKFEQLWADHINLTFYYGLLSLGSVNPISPTTKDKMDMTAAKLLQLQQDLSDLMQSCVPSEQKQALTQLLKDHILIVAQIAAKWRESGCKVGNGGAPFDPALVQAWYKNAADTVQLLESKTGHLSDDLKNIYNAHLDTTAAYLSAITQMRGTGDQPPMVTQPVMQTYSAALVHIPMLAQVFCKQMQACQKS